MSEVVSTINVVELQYAPTEAGPWGEPEVDRITLNDLEGWDRPVRIYRGNAAEWCRSRVVSYARVQGDE